VILSYCKFCGEETNLNELCEYCQGEEHLKDKFKTTKILYFLNNKFNSSIKRNKND